MKKLLNKKSLLAFVMVCVLALSNAGATNCAASSSGKGMDITDTLTINAPDEGKSFTKDGNKINLVAGKDAWANLYFVIEPGVNVQDRTVIQIVLEASEGMKYVKKLQEGGPAAFEEGGELKGGEETITWTVPAENLSNGTDANPQKLLFFFKYDADATGDEWVEFKSVKLLTPEEAAAADEEVNDDANADQGTNDDANADQGAADDGQNDVPKTGDASVFTWVALFAVGSVLVVAAKKRQMI